MQDLGRGSVPAMLVKGLGDAMDILSAQIFDDLGFFTEPIVS